MIISITVSAKYGFICKTSGEKMEKETVSYSEGMKQLRKLEKILNKTADMIVNQYNKDLSFKTLVGRIDGQDWG